MRSSDWSSDVCSSDLLLESHRVKELARRSLEGAGHAKDVLDLASLLKDIRGELWAGREDKFAARMRDQYLQLLTDLKGVLGKESDDAAKRSEEHTSELQSLMRSSYAVFCLKTKNIQTETTKSIR